MGFQTLAASNVGGGERPMDPKRSTLYSTDREKTKTCAAKGRSAWWPSDFQVGAPYLDVTIVLTVLEGNANATLR